MQVQETRKEMEVQKIREEVDDDGCFLQPSSV